MWNRKLFDRKWFLIYHPLSDPLHTTPKLVREPEVISFMSCSWPFLIIVEDWIDLILLAPCSNVVLALFVIDALLADLQNTVPGAHLNPVNGSPSNGTSGYGCLKGARRKDVSVSCHPYFRPVFDESVVVCRRISRERKNLASCVWFARVTIKDAKRKWTVLRGKYISNSYRRSEKI